MRLTSRLIYCGRSEDMVLINFVLLFIGWGVYGAYEMSTDFQLLNTIKGIINCELWIKLNVILRLHVCTQQIIMFMHVRF